MLYYSFVSIHVYMYIYRVIQEYLPKFLMNLFRNLGGTGTFGSPCIGLYETVEARYMDHVGTRSFDSYTELILIKSIRLTHPF